MTTGVILIIRHIIRQLKDSTIYSNSLFFCYRYIHYDY